MLVVALGIAGIAAAAPAAAQQTEPASRGGSTPGVQEISTGRQFALGAQHLRGNGTVECWGPSYVQAPENWFLDS